MISPKVATIASAVATMFTFGVLAPATARDAFEINLDVNGQTGSKGYSSIESAINGLSNTSVLQALVPSYTDISPAIVNIDLRGLPATANYVAGSTTLNVQIPCAAINRSFTGATRSDSAQQFLNYLEGQSGSITSLLGCAAKDSLIDPTTSLMRGMVGGDFDRALLDAVGPSPPGFGLDARFASFSGSGFSAQTLSVPLDYSWRLSERDALEVDVPLGYSDAGGGKSYSGNVGLMWRRRVTTNWTLQPSVRIGGVGSIDLGSAAGVWSVALNSTLKFDLPRDWQLTIVNGLTYIATTPINVGRFSINYNLSNVVFRNGLVGSHDLGFQLMNLALRGSVFFIDTRFTGSAVFLNSYQEMGFFVSAGSLTPIRLGATFLIGDHNVHGFSANTGVKF
jgi:hypothetical protein